ncbi:hypothetical protein [Paractinoplanes globisporus]|uniref:Uncharacterized protein n=1 Tax=Paractinoplanes globisporus TaxID=113565 RepID=A0ABW6WEY0_9ACTN|nr:hypothetical protein [Actinoplanes globisporus]
MDNVVTVRGPFAASPTVRHCDLGAHRLRDDEPWWQVTDFSRGWADGKGVACAAHLAETEAAFSAGQTYKVGGLFDAERTRWPQGPHLWMDDEDVPVRLAIFLTDPSPREIAAVETGKARFGWTEQGINGFLLFKYGDSPWNDAPFNPQRLHTPFALQPMSRGTHTRMLTFLVHADTGRIAAMRMFSWPAYFLNHVIASARRLQDVPYDEAAANLAQQDFYDRYPDGPSLYRLVRALPPEATCTGGQRDDRPH